MSLQSAPLPSWCTECPYRLSLNLPHVQRDRAVCLSTFLSYRMSPQSVTLPSTCTASVQSVFLPSTFAECPYSLSLYLSLIHRPHSLPLYLLFVQRVRKVCLPSSCRVSVQSASLYFCCTVFAQSLPCTLQWGAADAEMKVVSVENTGLKGSRFKAWSISIYYSHTCYAYCQGFFLY